MQKVILIILQGALITFSLQLAYKLFLDFTVICFDSSFKKEYIIDALFPNLKLFMYYVVYNAKYTRNVLFYCIT